MESGEEQAEPVSPMASVERQRPLSLPKNLLRVCGVPGQRVLKLTHLPLMQVVELVVLRQDAARPGCTSTSRSRRPAPVCPGCEGNRGQRQL